MPHLSLLIKRSLINFPTKIRIFIPILLTIIVSISIITYYSIYVTRINIYESIENYLRIEVNSLKKMFEREHELKLQNAHRDMSIIHDFFYQRGFRVAQETVLFEVHEPELGIDQTLELPRWYLGDEPVHNSYAFVDKISQTLGSKATIFQKTSIGFVRISTNVLDSQDQRAVGTVIPFDSPMARSVLQGEHFFGRAFVLNNWYVTGYGPIHYQGDVVGMMFVGTSEKDLPELSQKFYELSVGKSGYPFVFDKHGEMVINHHPDQHEWRGLEIIDQMIAQRKGVLRFLSPVDGKRKIIAFDYFPEFELYIAAFVNKQDETWRLIAHLIYGSVLVSLIITLIISFTVYFMTVEKLHSYLVALENGNQQLASAREALKQAEKLATMGQLSAGIAHEVNNPLGVVLMYSHLLMEETDPALPLYKDLEKIATQANRCKTILSGLLNFARRNDVNKRVLRIDQFFDLVTKTLVIPKSVRFQISHQHPEVEIELDPDQMTQVFINLINNAVDAIKSRGTITVATRVDKQHIEFEVADSGPGISEENQKRLFEPFFSTKQMGKGTGLGLAVCYGIIKIHQGQIRVESNHDPLQGPTFTRFVIQLPRRE